MSEILRHIETLPPLLVTLVALCLATGTVRLADGEGRRSWRGPGGPARIAAALLFLYAGIAANGRMGLLEAEFRGIIHGFFAW